MSGFLKICLFVFCFSILWFLVFNSILVVEAKEEGCYCTYDNGEEQKISETNPEECSVTTFLTSGFIECVFYLDNSEENEKKQVGEECQNGEECLSGLCSENKCWQVDVKCNGDADCLSGNFCNPQTQKCDTKKTLGDSCNANNECLSGYCEPTGTDGFMGRCAEKIDSSAGSGEVGDECKTANDCKSGRCDYNNFKCLPPLNKCSSHKDCSASQYCLDSLCTQKKEKCEVCQGANESCVTGLCHNMRCKEKESDCSGSGSGSQVAPTSTKLTPDMPTNIGNLNQLNTKGSAGLPALIGNLISKALGVVGSIALAMFVYGGLLWMSSAGNAERQKKAVNVIVWASFGIIIILSSYVVVSFVYSVL